MDRVKPMFERMRIKEKLENIENLETVAHKIIPEGVSLSQCIPNIIIKNL